LLRGDVLKGTTGEKRDERLCRYNSYSYYVYINDSLIYSNKGAFENLKKSEFYDKEPQLPQENEESPTVAVKVATTYKAGSIMVNQRQVISAQFSNCSYNF